MENSSVEGVCDVNGCEAESERSIAVKKVIEAGLPLKNESIKKVQLCKQHYKEFKKTTKKDRELDKLGW
ncbi:MAG: hypothetical protein PHW93_00230 [Candidatus Methanomethylophilaceae archaeon]|nr:hypothetical protein [Candidatus Methanomethylophilaceae archaeon]NBK25527.1 hypothetical protein [Spirochaetia bacterium]